MFAYSCSDASQHSTCSIIFSSISAQTHAYYSAACLRTPSQTCFCSPFGICFPLSCRIRTTLLCTFASLPSIAMVSAASLICRHAYCSAYWKTVNNSTTHQSFTACQESYHRSVRKRPWKQRVFTDQNGVRQEVLERCQVQPGGG